jgi:hypothetical protein
VFTARLGPRGGELIAGDRDGGVRLREGLPAPPVLFEESTGVWSPLAAMVPISQARRIGKGPPVMTPIRGGRLGAPSLAQQGGVRASCQGKRDRKNSDSEHVKLYGLWARRTPGKPPLKCPGTAPSRVAGATAELIVRRISPASVGNFALLLSTEAWTIVMPPNQSYPQAAPLRGGVSLSSLRARSVTPPRHRLPA